MRLGLIWILLSGNAVAKCGKCDCVAYLSASDRDDPSDVALNAKVRTGYVPDPAKSERFILRPVGGSAVAVSEAKLHVDSYDTLVLTPASPLAKNSEYELVLLRGDKSLPYFKLKTTDGVDASAPTWEGKLEASYEPPDGCDVDCQERRAGRITLYAPVPKDDRSGADLVAVWITSGAALDYDKPASAHLGIRVRSMGLASLGGDPQVTIVLGGGGPCKQEALKLPVGAKQLRIGMKVFDRAGNASAPREVLVKIPGGVKKPAW
jgi:hypothetical protein